MYGSGTFSKKGLNDMTKILKTLEDSDVLMKGVTQTLKNDIGASLLTRRGYSEQEKDYTEQTRH